MDRPNESLPGIDSPPQRFIRTATPEESKESSAGCSEAEPREYCPKPMHTPAGVAEPFHSASAAPAGAGVLSNHAPGVPLRFTPRYHLAAPPELWECSLLVSLPFRAKNIYFLYPAVFDP